MASNIVGRMSENPEKRRSEKHVRTSASPSRKVKFKQDIIDLFTSKKYATRAALDIGAGRGSTTAALAVNFAVVVAIEKYWDLADEIGCCHLESNKLLRKDGSEITNIVRLHMDTLLPFAFANLVDQNFSAVVIDAQHDFESIARETFHVLRDIPCCVETIIYHDYCFEDVFQTILWFELSGLLTFQKLLAGNLHGFFNHATTLSTKPATTLNPGSLGSPRTPPSAKALGRISRELKGWP